MESNQNPNGATAPKTNQAVPSLDTIGTKNPIEQPMIKQRASDGTIL